MIIWFLFSIIALLLAYSASFNNIYTKLLQVLLAIWFAWFVSFGGGAFTDYTGYQLIYEHLTNTNELYDSDNNWYSIFFNHSKGGIEFGYIFLNVLFNKLGFSFVGFLFIYNFIVNLLLIKFIYRYKYPVFAIMILIGSHYYSSQANLIRQMMAVSIFLYATKYIESKKIVKFAIAIALSATIHFSSFFLLPLYFILNRNISKIVMVYIWLFSLFICVFAQEITSFSSLIIPFYERSLNSADNSSVGVTSTALSGLLNLYMLSIIIFKGKTNNSEAWDNKIVNLYFMGLVFTNLVILSPWFARFAIYFIISMIILIPQLPEMMRSSTIMKSKEKDVSKIVNYLLVSFYAFTLLRVIFSSDYVISIGTEMASVYEIFK